MHTFGDLKTDGGLVTLNTYLTERSYIDGYAPTQADVDVFNSISGAPSNYSNVLRWYKHISSFGEEKASFPGCGLSLPVVNGAVGEEKKAADDEEGDDEEEEIDLFGSDEEEDEEAARIREERLKAYAEKKAKKPGPIAKSQVLLDCKPWSDETDMNAMETSVRGVEMDGLVWGASKLNPVGYGINKLSILCTVEDEKVSVDDLIEKISEFEEYVQSVDIAAFNKDLCLPFLEFYSML